MTTMRSVAFAALVLTTLVAGCGSKSTDSSGKPDITTCAGAIDAAAVSLMDARKKSIDDRLGSTSDPQKESRMLERSQHVIDQLKAPLNERCTADNWPAEVLSCLTTVRKQEELRACLGKLPKDQAEHATGDIMKTMQANIKRAGMNGVAPGMMGGTAHGIPLMGGQGATPPPAGADPATTAAPAPVAPAPVAPAPAPAAPAN